MSGINKAKRLFERRKQRVRTNLKKLSKSQKARLSVFRSNRYIYVQLVDDVKGVTIASASSLEKPLREKFAGRVNITVAAEVGKLIADRAKKAKVTEVVFDKGAYLYHGRVKALADAARESGLRF